MNVTALNDIRSSSLTRFNSTWFQLDWLYGGGIPRGKISLWAGMPGVGKTRISVELLKRLDRAGMRSLIFQGELNPEEFAGEKMGGYRSYKIFVSPSVSIDEQIAIIEKIRPDLVITDSVQQVEEYKDGRGAKEIVRKLREVIVMTGTHVIFLSQTTIQGHAKGGTKLPHEVDLVAELKPLPEAMVQMQVPTKNRFGKIGRSIFFVHEDWGVDVRPELFGDKAESQSQRSSLGTRMGKAFRGMFGR